MLHARVQERFAKRGVDKGVINNERTGEACWLKFKQIRSACVKMNGYWIQVHTPEKSGWVLRDYKDAALKLWLSSPVISYTWTDIPMWEIFFMLETMVNGELGNTFDHTTLFSDGTLEARSSDDGTGGDSDLRLPQGQKKEKKVKTHVAALETMEQEHKANATAQV